jgi:hypothetical protein
MIWVYADEPRTGRFDASFSLIDDRGNPVDQSSTAAPRWFISDTRIARRFARQRCMRWSIG